MNANDKPYVFDETENFAVVYKPPKMHCTPAGNVFTANQHEPVQIIDREHNTLFDWYSKICPSFFDLMHRIDFETHGLVLFAKNKKSFNYFKDMQNEGKFIKEYSSICKKSDNLDKIAGFPEFNNNIGINNFPLIIESYFRPYGPGRKSVRPVIDDGKKQKETAKDKGGFYQTEIINIEGNVFTARIKRGFRHQIRCHLCWIGFPIKNDLIYSAEGSPDGKLALRSHALFFTDPASGKLKEYSISPLNCEMFLDN